MYVVADVTAMASSYDFSLFCARVRWNGELDGFTGIAVTPESSGLFRKVIDDLSCFAGAPFVREHSVYIRADGADVGKLRQLVEMAAGMGNPGSGFRFDNFELICSDYRVSLH